MARSVASSIAVAVAVLTWKKSPEPTSPASFWPQHATVPFARRTQVESVPAVVTDGIGSIVGVITTETHIAFRTYRPDDLGAGFSLGY